MEIKSTLQKPYTETQRIEFIVEQNHNNGYEIRETDDSLQAWGYTQEEKEAQSISPFKHSQYLFNRSRFGL